MNKADLDKLITLGKKYKWCSPQERDYLERHGVKLERTDFYSETPSLEEIYKSFEYENYIDINNADSVFDDSSIFEEKLISEYIKELSNYSKDFICPLEEQSNSFYWNNNQFSYNDALSYYGIIKKEEPRNIIEIGSGFSTFVAYQAIESTGTNLFCIDPQPRADITTLNGIEFYRKPVQEIDIDFFNDTLGDGDILFYDGSHTLKTGSDTVYFYLKILPYISRQVYVHVHDMRLPYPRNISALVDARLYWGEQYILLAHLQNKGRYKVIVANELMRRRYPEILKSAMNNRYAIGGTSIWFNII